MKSYLYKLDRREQGGFCAYYVSVNKVRDLGIGELCYYSGLANIYLVGLE